jgi:uncharacterized membrane protein
VFYIAAYPITLTIFFAADMAWLRTTVGRLYRPILGDLLLPEFNAVSAIIFYLAYPIGLIVFAIVPALRTGNIITALMSGALFGFFTYGTYDLTNQATLRNWSTKLTITDLTWGTILGGISALGAAWILKELTLRP